LRLDAVHAIADNSDTHILEELAERVRAATPEKHGHLILENEANEAERLIRRSNGAPRWYTAQWNDDVHHVLHVAATRESTGYYAEYKGDTAKLGRALAEGSHFRASHAISWARAANRAACLLQHSSHSFKPDQVGIGHSAIASLRSHRQTRCGLSPPPICCFRDPDAVHGRRMGATQPFPFCDFGLTWPRRLQRPPGRIRAVSGISDPAMRERIPDPLSDDTLAAAKLAWEDLSRNPCGVARVYRRILAVRHQEVVLRLSRTRCGGRYDARRWGGGGTLAQIERAAAARGLHPAPHAGFPGPSKRVLWREGDCGDDGGFGPFAVCWSIETVTGTAGAALSDQ
jgi:1,4-alpha-glucan branching enzyme